MTPSISSNRQKLLQFTSAGIIDYFAAAYNYEHGERKSKEVLSKVTASKRVGELLTTAASLGRFPTSKEILATLNGIPYFIFSKSETLCLASLSIVIVFENELSALSDDIKFLKENTPLCINIIEDCFKMKLNKESHVFKFFFSSVNDALIPPEPEFNIFDDIGDDDSFWGDYDSEINRGK